MAPNTDTAVIIAAYNAAATLDRAVASALAQPEVTEVCVVDDGSRDGTAERARAWTTREARVSVLQQANAGPAAARNAAIAATQSSWIAILDADDYLLEGRFARMFAHAADADFVGDNLMRVRDGAPAPPMPPLSVAEPLSFEGFVLGNLGARRGPLDLGYLKPLFRRDFVAANGLRYRPELRLGEDYEFYARALALGARFVITGAAGYVSVEREGSLSKAHEAEDLQRLRDCDLELAAIRPLSQTEDQALRRHWSSVDCRLQWRRLINAVKARDAGAAFATFHTPEASIYLASRLGEQVWLRSRAWMRGSARA